ncbi:GNAT family N-acetyltransferase [Tsuneonella amylolytica]|uniref:GNAT family N-acetyltransferase n=1 Tax=Tsuneonella amylolytica TaxID=2338327 RepID=UPI000EAAB8D2|nr:GNAT family N-acetyltransferase [Tsuneonella amylolytica]
MEHPVRPYDVRDPRADLLEVRPWRSPPGGSGWDGLAVRASEPNPFAERWCLAPALAAFDAAGGAMLAHYTVGGETTGIVPLARSARYDRYPLPHIGNWLHANAFLGTPLVAAGHEHGFWQALLQWADDNAGRALFLHFEGLAAEGPLFAALRDVCTAQGRARAIVHRHDRALLRSDLSPEAYFEGSMSAKKRKELRRQANRLADEGTVAFERREDAAGLDRWTAEFLALEAAGWKGAQGSAMASDPAKARFFADALAGAAAAGKLERIAIRLDGRPIAMLANFLAPPGAFSFKTAYDEGLARFSPGVLLQRENLALLSRRDIAWTDSCAAPDHPMIERIWREKRTIVRTSIAIGGRGRRALASAIFAAETRGQSRGQ